jgi:hypothetical protein
MRFRKELCRTIDNVLAPNLNGHKLAIFPCGIGSRLKIKAN